MSQETGDQTKSQVLQNNIAKTKNLMPLLSEVLNNLFKAATAKIQSSGNNPENKGNFEEQFEEFYSIVDQIEINLVTALKCVQQADSNRKFFPLPVSIAPQANSLTYHQFLKQSKAQIDYTKEIKNILSEF